MSDRLPFEPGIGAEMSSRYQAAIAPVYDQVAVANELAMAPSQFRPHVFDFQDGMRLIVSRERTPDGLVVLHLSAGAEEGSRLCSQIEKRSISVGEFLDLTVTRSRQLSGSRRTPMLIGFSAEKKIPHWYLDEEH